MTFENKPDFTPITGDDSKFLKREELFRGLAAKSVSDAFVLTEAGRHLAGPQEMNIRPPKDDEMKRKPSHRAES
jgi:hypothetical protein